MESLETRYRSKSIQERVNLEGNAIENERSRMEAMPVLLETESKSTEDEALLTKTRQQLGLGNIQKEKAAEEPSPYDFEKLSPHLQQAVNERVKRILETTPLDGPYFAGVFNLKEKSIFGKKELYSPEQLRYFQAYGKLAIRQLVMGDFFGKEEPIKEEDEVIRELKERPLGGTSATLRKHEDQHLAGQFTQGVFLAHDITHTWVDLAESSDQTDLSNAVPKFLRFKRSMEENVKIADASAQDEDIVTIYNIDGANRSRGGLKKSIRQARSREAFVNFHYRGEKTPNESPAFKKYIRGRLYDEYKTNPHLLFELFAEATLPLMEKYAPEEAAALLRQRSVY